MNQPSDDKKLHLIQCGNGNYTDPSVIPLDEFSVQINTNFVINIPNESIIDKTGKRNCKVIKISFGINIDEVFDTLAEVNAKEYPNLFIFIIEGNLENENVEKLKIILLKFDATRPMVLQVISKDEAIAKYYYKDEISTKFQDIDLQQTKCEKFQNFSAFLCYFLAQNIENLEDDIIEKLPESGSCSLTLKFLRTLNLSDNFFDKLILKNSAHGSKKNLLAALDAPFIDDGRVLTLESQEYLAKIICEDPEASETSFEENEQILEEDDDSQSSEASSLGSKSSNSHLNPSVLFTAIQNSNREVIDYLISQCTHLIQQLPFKHQVRISTTALESDQFDVLCDLLELSDFPFPEHFNLHSVTDERLRKLAVERNNFGFSIKKQNYTAIEHFISNNLSLRMVYNPENKTALKQAIDAKKYKVYFHLKSLGFMASEFENYKEVLNGNELKKANQAATEQRRANTQNALSDANISVMLLSTRSFIHNRKINKQQEAEYRTKIKKWYEDIMKIEFGPELLYVAASCEYLRIIFDFDSDSVENVSFQGKYTLGSTYPTSKWIFVGSKLFDKRREQQIKGVLAHELCHYVMRLVYENIECPYFKHRVDIAVMFEAIVKVIDKWSSKDFEHPDDECNGTISSVFQCYDSKDFHPELIVRIVQILSEFDDDQEKLRHLMDLYGNLFEFFRTHVLPDLQKFNLKNRECVRKLNRIIELLPTLTALNIEFSSSKDISTLTNDKLVIARTNIPKLLLVNIHNCLYKEQGVLFDAQNLFIDSQKLKNEEIVKDIQQIVKDYQAVSILILFSDDDCKNLEKIIETQSSIMMVPNKSYFDDLLGSVTSNKLNPKTIDINYDIKDLTIESQKSLLQLKIINFQGNTNFSFFDLLQTEAATATGNPDSKQATGDGQAVDTSQAAESSQTKDTKEANILENFIEIVNDELLRNLVDRRQIVINRKVDNDLDEKFEYLYQHRQLIKKGDRNHTRSENVDQIENYNEHDEELIAALQNGMNHDTSESSYEPSVDTHSYSSETSNEESEDEIYSDFDDYSNDDSYEDYIEPYGFGVHRLMSLEHLPNDAKSQKYVLISDIAGTGKSWAMKKIANILREKTPTRWVTYVDLKQFISIFIEQNAHLDFLAFFTEKILKLSHSFESKLFTKLYKNGKVSILFDGFDEIAPNCAEFVSQLAKSFEINGGNQLWVATRDYFEVDLKKILELDTVYKLAEFTEKDGIHFITRSWLLHDFENQNGSKSKESFEKFVENSPKFKDYKNTAYHIVKKISVLKSRSIGLPQLFKMIVNVFKNNKDAELDFKEFLLYEKFGKALYERWLEKGEIRKNANTNSLQLKLNFWTLHQYVAIKSLFPKYSNKELEKGLKEWIDEEIVACGLMTKRDGILSFLHETFREFFAADFVVSKLRNSKVDEEFLGIFVEILTVKKLGVIRMFINDAIDNNSVLEKIEERMQNFMEKFYNMETFSSFFTENLDSLVDLILKTLKNGDYENVLNLFNQRTIHNACKTKNPEVFSKFQEFLIANFKRDDLMKILKLKDNEQRNLLLVAAYESKDVMTHQNLWIIYRRVCKNDREFFKILQDVCEFGFNPFHAATYYSSEVAIFMIEELDKILLPNEIKIILNNMGKSKTYSFHTAAYHLNSSKLHEDLWKIHRKYFEPSEILGFIKHFNSDDNNIIFDIVINNTIQNVKFTWNQIKSFLTHDEQIAHLKTIGYAGQNLLERSLENKAHPEVSKWVKNTFREYGIENFLNDFEEILKQFKVCIQSENEQDFEKLWTQIENAFSPEECEEFVKKRLIKHEKILHKFIVCKKSEIHETLWKFLLKIIHNPDELTEFILRIDKEGQNFIHDLVNQNKVPSIIQQIVDIFKHNFSDDQFEEILKSKNQKKSNLLQIAAYGSQEIEIHRILWPLFQQISKSDQEYAELIRNIDESGKNALHYAAYYELDDVFIFMIDEIDKIPLHDEIRKILSNIGDSGQNIIQSAGYFLKSPKVHEELWKIYRKYFKHSEILAFIKHINKDDNNLIFDIVINNTVQNVEFIWNQMKNYLNYDEQVETLKTIGYKGQNLIERCSKNYDVKKWVEKIVIEYGIEYGDIHL